MSMRYLSLHLVRAFLVAGLLFATAAIAGAQQAPADPSAAAVAPLTQAERARYVGVYDAETPDGVMPIHIYEEGERLMGRPEHEDEPSPLTYLGEHRFVPDLMQEAILTFTIEGDRATRFTIAFPDERGTMVATRRP
jgi:hypothetical protein